MSGLFRKEVKSAPIVEVTQSTPEPLSFLGKGTRAANEEDKSQLHTLEGLAKHAAGREARRDVARRPRR